MCGEGVSKREMARFERPELRVSLLPRPWFVGASRDPESSEARPRAHVSETPPFPMPHSRRTDILSPQPNSVPWLVSLHDHDAARRLPFHARISSTLPSHATLPPFHHYPVSIFFYVYAYLFCLLLHSPYARDKTNNFRPWIFYFNIKESKRKCPLVEHFSINVPFFSINGNIFILLNVIPSIIV